MGGRKEEDGGGDSNSKEGGCLMREVKYGLVFMCGYARTWGKRSRAERQDTIVGSQGCGQERRTWNETRWSIKCI